MTKLDNTQMKKFLDYLNKHKHLVGLQGWTMFINKKCIAGEALATCEPNIYEQTLIIDISESFLSLQKKRQESILIHELIHGRINIYHKIMEELTAYEEERLANDLERGIYSLLE